MKIQNLRIERNPDYGENANTLKGKVQLEGERGKMEVLLSASTLSSIFALIKIDVQKTAAYNASQSGDAVDEAENEIKLINADIIKD